LRALLTKYKLVIRFILTFVLVYGVLTMVYKLYLDHADSARYYPDYITNVVGKQSEALISSLGYDTIVEPHADEPSLMVFINRKYTARIVEGCNAVSVIILFIAFIIAFADGFKKTALYLLAGSILIYAVNIVRIAILAIGLFHYPEREELHTIVFPLIIYGAMFLLWIIWINRFSASQKTANA